MYKKRLLCSKFMRFFIDCAKINNEKVNFVARLSFQRS
jgi:hypothetical protein